MESPTGIIPESLMYPQKKAEVVAHLQSLPLPGDLKRRLLEGWAITVGVRCQSKDYRVLEQSGVDGININKASA